MLISLNSLEAKTSPHSRHATNSASSSRATMRTRGCLHFGRSIFIAGGWTGRDVVIDSGLGRSDPSCSEPISPELAVFLAGTRWLSSTECSAAKDYFRHVFSSRAGLARNIRLKLSEWLTHSSDWRYRLMQFSAVYCQSLRSLS